MPAKKALASRQADAADCCEARMGRRSRVREFGKTLVVDWEVERAQSVVCELDGCLVENALAPDFAIHDDDSRVLLAELKGKDVMHALDQLDAGFRYWRSQHPAQTVRRGVVVCSEVPREQSRIQVAKLRFAREFNALVKIFNRDSVTVTFTDLREV